MNEKRRVLVEQALLGEEYSPSGPVEIVISEGRIASITPTDSTQAQRLLAMPALVDAHNHGRALSTTSFGCGGKPLEAWLPQLAVMPSVDAYTGAVASFTRSLLGGATAIMVHLTRPMGLRSLPEEARQIAQAAQDVGVCIGFAVAMRDRNPLVYGDHAAILDTLDDDSRRVVEQTWLRAMPSINQQLALVEAVADAVADMPNTIDVQFGPTGVQWCSDELLSAIAGASAQSGRRIHMHLLETVPQRAWADATYPAGIVQHLESLGLLSERLTLAHCVWATSEELARIAAHDSRVVVNASSNLHLRSGIAPAEQMLAQGVKVAMGLDGCAFDEDDDGLRELRLFYLLNQARGFEPGTLTPARALRAACSTGRAGLGMGPGGVLSVGMPADMLLLDLATLDRDAIMPVDPRDYLFSRASKAHIVDVYAAGRQVVEQGVPVGVDLPETERQLRTAMREGLAEKQGLMALWPTLEKSIAAHYRGCC